MLRQTLSLRDFGVGQAAGPRVRKDPLKAHAFTRRLEELDLIAIARRYFFQAMVVNGKAALF
jgi:hypothetical protein